ncbi:hypothetical protein AVEN_75995-1 [Araneus ventricosus]|uniref:Uncharacterized protein n=1 Tax=Araneus ventricosus TaxID=182803 RepID=A0A4Y2FDF5_ARAVE|nr:hypothetical protein AVEN_75995-1 [Araneus ventricosus]
MPRCKHDSWSFPRCWGSLDLRKDEVDVPSSVTVVPFTLPELGRDGMKILFQVAPRCWILCWDPFQGSFLGEKIRCLVTRMSNMRFNPAEFNVWRVEKDVVTILF